MSQCSCHPSFPTPAQPPNYKDMQAIAAIVNPDTVGRVDADGKPAGQQVILFQSLPNGTLGFDQVQFNGDHGDLSKQNEDGVIGYYTNPSKLVPTLKFGSSLATVVLDDVVRTYGVLEGDSSVWLLSPIVMPLENARIPYGSIAATSDGDKNGKLFWQDKRDGKFQLKCRDLNARDDGGVWIDGTEDSKEGTDIAAFYDGEDFWVIYQSTSQSGNSKKAKPKDYIKAVPITGDGQGFLVDGSSDKLNGELARIAACRAEKKGGGADVDRVYVYFTDQYSTLHVGWANCTRGGNLTFQNDVKNFKGLIVHEKSRIAAVASPLDSRNEIYAVTGTNSKISHTADKWN
ncbi:hypothetical protein QBC42DRAFT_323563 [Cladorrhinum samala]|uniref:Fucose-specific lectin n=1 Tax=Cladorrhinum samala TaxID=585594 RepID=A0AAV9I154_9PEZI|nr:hypothetical protein QBC42DRAFT_323563 [Cladorrhinum samala]